MFDKGTQAMGRKVAYLHYNAPKQVLIIAVDVCYNFVLNVSK